MKTLAIIAAILVVAIAAGQGPTLSAGMSVAKNGLVKLMPGGGQPQGDEQDGDPEESSEEP
jgi:hypothetical protein